MQVPRLCSNDAALQVHSLSMSINVVYIHMLILHTNLKSTASHAALMFCSTLRKVVWNAAGMCISCDTCIHVPGDLGERVYRQQFGANGPIC
jgi:hypothetical protein